MALHQRATILHADLDAFYAKAFGVHPGMPAWRARQRCPALVFVEATSASSNVWAMP